MADIAKGAINKNKRADEDADLEYIKWQYEISGSEINDVGEKAVFLSELYKNKFQVPPYFVITSKAFNNFIEPIEGEIKGILELTDINNIEQLYEHSKRIRELIEKQNFPPEVEKEIFEAYEFLGTEKKDNHITGDAMNILRIAKEPVFVAVRCSQISDNSGDASFAGQHDSFMNIKGNQRLIFYIKKCFSSLYTPQAIYYRSKKKIKNNFSLAVIVQKMINSDRSGIMFTYNPINAKKEIIIEAAFGLGEAISLGIISPDNYTLNYDLDITDKLVADKKKAFVRNASGETQEVLLTGERSIQQALTDGEIKEIANLGIRISELFKKPQNIEFVFEDKTAYIIQSRTVPGFSLNEPVPESNSPFLLKGNPISPGFAKGKINMLNSRSLLRIKKDEIILTSDITNDIFVPIYKCKGIISDKGSISMNAAIIAREIGIPFISGIKKSDVLADGRIVSIDGDTGKIYEGEISNEKENIIGAVETKTKLRVIVDSPKSLRAAVLSKCDSSMLRLEGIIFSSGKHPVKFLNEGKIDLYCSMLKEVIEKTAENFDVVWVKASDMLSNESAFLEGSPKEPEINPLMGMHGIRFLIRNKKIFEAELNAIKEVAQKFPNKKFAVIIPNITSVNEIVESKKEYSKFKTNNMKLGVMVDNPACAQIIENLCDYGINFAVFNAVALAQHTLALDKENPNLKELYNEMHPAVLNQIDRVIQVCQQKGIEISFCMENFNDKMVSSLINKGIFSICVSPDIAFKVSELIRKIELPSTFEVSSEDGLVNPITKEISEMNKSEKIIIEIPDSGEAASSEKENKNAVDIDTLDSDDNKKEFCRSDLERDEDEKYDPEDDIFYLKPAESMDDSEPSRVITIPQATYSLLDFDAQFLNSPIFKEINEKISQKINLPLAENILETVPEKLPENVPENKPEIPGNKPQNLPENKPEIPGNVPNSEPETSLKHEVLDIF